MDTRWLVGFIEGEGCFSIGFIKTKDSRFGYQIKAMFAIKITLSEKQVLEEIRTFLGNIGNLYFESSETNRKKGMKNANDSISFRVTKIEELKKIINLLQNEKFVSKQKRQDFDNWVKCINLFENKKHLTKKGFLEIARIREQMHKRKQANKQSFCELRSKTDPCDIYRKTGKIPISCDKCGSYISK